MRNDNLKNQNVQIPSEGRTANQSRTFEKTLERFFESNDSIGHITFLTDLCRSYMGGGSNPNASTSIIADGVYSANVLKDFLERLSYSYHCLNDLTPEERDLYALILDAVAWPDFSDLINYALQEWIHPEGTEFTVAYMKSSLDIFDNIIELITISSRLHNHFVYSLNMEGGAVC